VPSLRYAIHLSAPGMDVIGAGEPALPGVSIGHNGNIAFGFTVFSMDQEDLYVYKTNPDDPSEYRYEGRWEPMQVERQLIPVKDGDPVEERLKFTRHGPVIYEDTHKNIAFAVRAAWLEPGTAPYLGSVDYMRAGDWDGFLAAMNRWGAPGENQVYADTDGNIGWKPAGLVPRRPNWDGLLPVPGDGRYEWDGFLDADELPVEFNAPRGWVASANQMNLPEGYPHEEKKVSFEWYAPYRYERIAEVLRENPSFGLEDSVKLQTDYLSVPARRIVARLRRLRPSEPELEQILAILKSWDCVLSAGSAPAALFEVWYRMHLREALLGKAMEGIVEPGRLGEAVSRMTPVEDQAGDARMILETLEELDTRPGHEEVDEVLSSTLMEATEHLERLLGVDRADWEWGKLHQVHMVHPLSPLVDTLTRERLDVGPVPRGGSGDTVGNTAYHLENLRQTGGSSWRVVVDVGEWDYSLFINSPGQSGDPASPHYSDLFRTWARDETVPLLYSRRKVEAAAERRIVLEPTRQ
jgi:penicillin G amidase